jgi:hypothetical protein
MPDSFPRPGDRSGADQRAATSRDEIRTTVDTVVAAGQLLVSPRKSKIWHETWLHGGLTIKELTRQTTIPQSTLYDLTREMVAEGSLYEAGTTDNNATVYKPVPMQLFVSEHPQGIGPQFSIQSTLIGVVGRGVDSPDVELFLDRASYTLLVEAIAGVMAILSDDAVTETSLDEYFDWMNPANAHLIQGHISAVLEREAALAREDWEFPDQPVIAPADPSGR